MNEGQEIPVAKEVFSSSNERVSLQTRLILGGEALSPSKTDLKKIRPENLSGIKQETVKKINNASTKERSDYWQGKGDFDQQLKSWCDSMVKYLDNPNFTEKDALDIYQQYFEENKGESNINIYVDEIIAGHTQEDGKFDFDLLSQNLPTLKKMAHIFGGNSSEIIEDLILARAKLTDPDKKQELIDQINEEKTINDSPTLRINYLNPDEERLLRWLDQDETLTKIKAPSPPTKPLPGEYYWKYRKLDGDIRIFPKELTYAKLAHDLRTDQPKEFSKYTTRELAGFVKGQLEETQARLDKFGLTQQELKNLSLDFVDKQVLSHYREFIQKKYNITLPSTEEIQILPISGAIAKAHDKTGRGLAFVDAKFPVIFLNVDNIANSSQRIVGQPWEKLSLEERKQYFIRILTEINPHEYTHLLGDLAFWELTAKNDQGQEQELESFTGKLGLKMGKPKNLHEIPQGVQFEFLERGRGLMEAVTVEMTQQWVNSMGKELTKIYGRPISMRLDVPAYPGERQVLYALENLISQDKGITDDKAFEIFVRAYFTNNGFREIVEAIDDHKIGQDGNKITRRPHFTSEIYSLMKYEEDKPKAANTMNYYPLTLNFIWGKLTLEQKQEILTNLNKLEIAPAIKNHLSTLLSSTVPVPIKPQSTEEKEKPTETNPDPLLLKIFSEVKGEVSKNHRYYVENPPDQITLTEEQMDQLNLVEPFFVDIQRQGNQMGWSANIKVVPFVFELGDGADRPDSRFISGEAATNGDSGLVGLAAASAPTPEKQANFYKTLAKAIVDIHSKRFANSERPTLIDTWYGRQQQDGRWDDPNIFDSLSIFSFYDHDPETNELRPENERLLMYNDKGQLDYLDIGFWMFRTEELQRVLETGALKSYHLRWIELLAHSVNVPELVNIIKKS